MVLLAAFIVGGFCCCAWTFIYRLTKLSVPAILSLAVAIGGLVTALGWMTPIVNWADGGMILLIIDSGEAAYGWMTTILNDHTFYSCAQHLLTLGIVFSLSALIGGRIYYNKYGKKAIAAETKKEA